MCYEPALNKATVILTHFVDFCAHILGVNELGLRAMRQDKLVRI